MKIFLLATSMILLAVAGVAQSSKLWTAADRQYLLENLQRTKNEIIRATENLTEAQWSFKPAPDKWSIGQVLEHLGLYERIFEQEADIMLSTPPEPDLYKAAYADSVYINWMNDPSAHKAEKNATPLGLMKGKDNLTFFLFGRESILAFVQNTSYDLKAHYTFRWGDEKRRSIHSLMVIHFAHTDRHLKQMERIKKSEGYPQ
jgi:hypothetical protein